MKKTDIPPHTMKQSPSLSATAFIAKGAQVMGDVRLEQHSSIWYNAVVRGDINFISIGEGSNIQDGSVIHVTNDAPCIIGNNVTVGHHVNLHACTIEDGCLIGIGAIILSGAHIKKGSIIGAGTVVLEGSIIEENSLVVGVPGKVVRKIDKYQENLEWAIKYQKLAQIHKSHTANK